MLKAIWMSDTHFAQEGTVLEHNSRERLAAAIRHINGHHRDASFCLITGDLVNRGTLADYKGLQSHLETLAMPVLPMVGNHDDRDILRSLLPLPDTCMDKFIQYSVSTDEALILCLDSQKTGSDAGEFCGARRAWLTDKLQNSEGKDLYIFMHHPPMPLGLPMQDTENLEDGPGFLDLLSKFDCVKHLFLGHVHRPITGTVRGIPFATMRSTAYQAPPPQPDWTWDSFKPSEEAPNLGVLTVANSDVNLQYVQFCAYETGVVGG